ncbi:MAG: A/G-specific adenine glycosylase [Longimicrobiales bacterium]|nr:A/G-specific adenine glycosylase [Longimicrobiales bacterium]
MSRSVSSAPMAHDLAPAEVRAVRRAVLAHYDRTRRDLPWRTETDPYRIWVSEVMLQQTRVETVLPYYRRWMERFPDAGTLADASLDDVLLAWQGLGYYRRARALHAGARVVRERWGGVIPGSYEELRALPGVGEYTASAVASIAFGAPLGAVDGNVTRVLARLFDRTRPSPRWLRATAAELVDRGRPGDWNQALMDLGATVCMRRRPACGRCPIAKHCRSLAAGTQEERPATAPGKVVQARTLATAVVVDGDGRGLLVRRADDGLLAGLWAFPDAEVEEGVEAAAVARAARKAARSVGASLSRSAPRALATVRHRFTHLSATYRPVVLAGRLPEDENRRWVPLGGPWPVALPVAQQKIARAAAVALGPSEPT